MATMKELREECAKLGITPGRSIAETEKRIAAARAQDESGERLVGLLAQTNAMMLGEAEDARAGLTPDQWRAAAKAPEPVTPEEEQAMAEYSAEMRRMDAMGETAWMAEQFKPRMSRLMRMLADTTAICGTLARNPLIYGGDPDRHDYATGTGYLVVASMQARGQWLQRQPWPTPRRFA